MVLRKTPAGEPTTVMGGSQGSRLLNPAQVCRVLGNVGRTPQVSPPADRKPNRRQGAMGISIRDFVFHNADGTHAGFLARGQYEVLRRHTFSELEEMLVQRGSAYKLMRRLPVSRGCRHAHAASRPRANALQWISRYPYED